nr:hypothetical protein [Tanacetum cinerariifolium]
MHETVQDVPCGNIVAMAGLDDEAIPRFATLTNNKTVGALLIRAMKFSVSSVVRAVSCKFNSDRPKLLEDLNEDFMGGAWIKTSEFFVACRETVFEKSSLRVMCNSANNLNHLYMEARRMEDVLVKAIDEGRIGPLADPRVEVSARLELGFELSRRGKVIEEISRAGTIYIKAYLSVAESFRFSSGLMVYTNDEAFLQCVFDHWDMMLSDPLDACSDTWVLVATIRKMKRLE